MNSNETCLFTSVTHGRSDNCEEANEKLKETLINYNFGSFSVEQPFCQCPNNDCNTSFILILSQKEFFRLKQNVIFDVTPTFLVHNSFIGLLQADRMIRAAQSSVETQVTPKMIDNPVEVTDSICQTDVHDEDVESAQMDSEEEEDDLDESEPEVDELEDIIFLEEIHPPVDPFKTPTTVKQEPFFLKREMEDSFNSMCSTSSSKRAKIDDVEMCHMCLDLTFYSILEEYSSHILEMHLTIPRFKCNMCEKKFSVQKEANQHIREHLGQGDVSPGPIISSEITTEDICKFKKFGIQCYPDKFRDVTLKEIGEIIKDLP